MIFLHTLLLVVALASSMQEMLWEYRLQMKADALYERRAYREAETVFRQLVSLSPEPKKRAAATFNLACALYMQGKYPEAGTLFASNSKPDNEHRENRLKAIFNEGNTPCHAGYRKQRKSTKKRSVPPIAQLLQKCTVNQPG